jgi:hypothetical protein
LQALREATDNDRDLQRVMSYTLEGWPQHVHAALNEYKNVQAELSVSDGLLIYQNRVVVPASQRKQVLEKLHESHQGITKSRELAKQSVWWPGINRDVTSMIQKCHECQQSRPAQRNEPLKPTELPSRPWVKVGADLFKLNNKDYLVMIDYYSRWIELKMCQSTTSMAIINKFKQVFATHGIPEELVTDNGPQFASREFANFAEEYGFRHHTTSPYFPQANGEAERAVQTSKKILKQKDSDVAMLNYNTTPHAATGVSPSVALMGRQLRSKIPVLQRNLQPVGVNDREIRQHDDTAKSKTKQHYDRHHGARQLPELPQGSSVLIKTDDEKGWKRSGKVRGPADESGRSYVIDTPQGEVRRNRKHLLMNRRHPQADDEQHTVSQTKDEEDNSKNAPQHVPQVDQQKRLNKPPLPIPAPRRSLRNKIKPVNEK